MHAWTLKVRLGVRCRAVVARLAREVQFLMFAGTDTTAVTICRAMQCLASHPEWLEALAEEQQRLIAEHGEKIDRKVRTLLQPHLQRPR